MGRRDTGLQISQSQQKGEKSKSPCGLSLDGDGDDGFSRLG